MSFPPNTGSVELSAFTTYASRLLASGERLDKRDFTACRIPTVVREEQNGAEAASGAINSSSVLNSAPPIGAASSGHLAAVMYTDEFGTCIQCTVQGLLGPPRPDRSSAGRLNVRVEAPFLEHLSGGGGFSANPLSAQYTVSNGNADLPLRQLEGYIGSVLEGCLDLRQLCLYDGEACWVLTVQVTLLGFDGGLRSASLHAALAALHRLRLPRTRLPNGDVVDGRVVQLSALPVACTFGLMAGAQVRLVADTTAIEEHMVDGLLTVTVGESGEVIGVHHTGRCPLLGYALTAAVQQWVDGSAALRKAVYA